MKRKISLLLAITMTFIMLSILFNARKYTVNSQVLGDIPSSPGNMSIELDRTNYLDSISDNKYRVYQGTTHLSHWVYDTLEEAISEAVKWDYSRIELNGEVVWKFGDHQYKVYQYNTHLDNWTFSNLNDAIAEAVKWDYSRIENKDQVVWRFGDHQYKVYQYSTHLDNWTFSNLYDAIAEAKKWNYSRVENKSKAVWKFGDHQYKVYQYNAHLDNWTFSNLNDAIAEAVKWNYSRIENKDQVVWRFGDHQYKVYQYSTHLDNWTFSNLYDAIAEAKKWNYSRVENSSQIVWRFSDRDRHLRASWISTVINLDWPSIETRDIKNDAERIQKSKIELISMLDKAVEMNMNAVFFQISPEGDAFYNSELVPWSRYLTGTFGKNPGFDPLQFGIAESHKRNLELHAWFNPYRASIRTDSSTKQSLNVDKSVYRNYPNWIREASDRLIVDPGIPEARNWVLNRVMEVVKNYDIDGIHFDDYFYLDGVQDQSTYEKYNNGRFSSKEDWRRNNTYSLVKEISENIESEKPWVKFGISSSGVWANKKDGYPDGSDTSANLSHYDMSFADTKKWVKEEIIDYIAPQIYWSFENTTAPYGTLGNWWAEIAKRKDVHLYMGQALYKVNSDSDVNFQGNQAVEEFKKQIKFNESKLEIMGSIFFRFKNLSEPEKQQVVNAIKKELWYNKVLVPAMPWKGGKAPQISQDGKMEPHPDGIRITWTDDDEDTSYYAVYRVDTKSNQSSGQLIGTVQKVDSGIQEFIDSENYDLDNYVYAITALDRLNHESERHIVKKSIP